MKKNKLKIFISIDYEGLSGVSSLKEIDQESFIRELKIIYEVLRPKGRGGYWGQIEKISICDSHGTGENIAYNRLQEIDDEKTFLISGPKRKTFMLEGMEGHDLLFLIGYHGRAGNHNSLMDHSYGYDFFKRVMINRKEVGEMEINAYLAGEQGIPLALITGDEALKTETAEFCSQLCFVSTKQARARFCAYFYPKKNVKRQYSLAFKRIFQHGYKGKCFKLKGSKQMQIDFFNRKDAWRVSKISDAKRLSEYSVGFTSNSYRKVFDFLQQASLMSEHKKER